MGLVDKLKNIFTEEVAEEEDEIKVEQIKKEVRSVPIESPSVERVQRKKRVEKPAAPVVEEYPLEDDFDLPEEKVKSPVFFTDRDFEDLAAPKKSRENREKLKAEKMTEEVKKEEGPKPYGGNYSSTTIIHKEKQNFKPTPIISPVYGVLDKNYHKEDIIDKNSDAPRESIDGLSVDSIRNKAYGTLEDDLEETIASKPSTKKREVVEDVDLFDELEQSAKENAKEPEKDVRKLEEITMDLTKELDNLLLKKEKEKKSKEEKKTLPKEEEKKEELAESDLFNLIDSMYEEGEDE